MPLLQVPEDAREVVLDSRSDEFYRKHAGMNFGEVGLSVKALMEEYQTRESKHRQVGFLLPDSSAAQHAVVFAVTSAEELLAQEDACLSSAKHILMRMPVCEDLANVQQDAAVAL
jgi:hypothetical protein